MKNNKCCGNSIDLSSFGTCKICMIIAFTSTFSLTVLYYFVTDTIHLLLDYFLFLLTLVFTLISILHILGFLANKEGNTLKNPEL